MNLRQKYKRAKQRLEMLEKTAIRPKLDVIPHDIVRLQSEHRINESVIHMLGPKVVTNAVIEELLDSTKPYVTVEHEPDIFTGKEIVRARLNIAIPRR